MIHWKGRIVFSSRQSLEILKGTVGREGSGILVLQIYSCFTLFTFSSFFTAGSQAEKRWFRSSHFYKFVFRFNPTFCLWVHFLVHFWIWSCRIRNHINLLKALKKDSNPPMLMGPLFLSHSPCSQEPTIGHYLSQKIFFMDIIRTWCTTKYVTRDAIGRKKEFTGAKRYDSDVYKS